MLPNVKHEAMAQRIATGTMKPSELPRQMKRETIDAITDRAMDIKNDDGNVQIGGGFKGIPTNLIGIVRDREMIVAQDLRASADLIEEFASEPATMGYGATAASAMINSIKKMASNCCSHDAYGITKTSVRENHPMLIEAIKKMIAAAEDGRISKSRIKPFGNEIEAIKMLIASGPEA